jgi:hypothetical protein
MDYHRCSVYVQSRLELYPNYVLYKKPAFEMFVMFVVMFMLAKDAGGIDVVVLLL